LTRVSCPAAGGIIGGKDRAIAESGLEGRKMLAALVLAIHALIIGFNLFGLVAVPLGAWRGWNWVHARTWRLIHLASLAIVALQAALGRACFLTIWQAELEGAQGAPGPLIVRLVNSLVYWPLPLWVFTLAYFAVLVYALALLWMVPLRRR
jgi:hypothetical protein